MAFGNSAHFDISASDKTGRAIASAKQNLLGLSSTANRVLGGLGIGLGVSSFVGLTKSAIDYSSKIADAATATNTSVEALQALNWAATLAGASQEQMATALVRVQKAAYDAQKGPGAAAEAFRLLKINVDEFSQLTPERKLEAVAVAMSKSANQGKAYGAALELLGAKTAPKLQEVLQRLAADGFDGVSESARKAVGIISNETVQALATLGDAMDEVKLKGMNFWAGLVVSAADAIPGLKSLNTELASTEMRLERTKARLEKAEGHGFNIYDKTTILRQLAELETAMLGLKARRDALSGNPLKADDILDSESIATAKKDLDGIATLLEKMSGIKDEEKTTSTDSVLATMEAYEKKLQGTREQYAELLREQQESLRTPAENIKLIADEINNLRKAMEGLDKRGLDWNEKAIDLAKKEMELARLKETEREKSERAAKEAIGSVSRSDSEFDKINPVVPPPPSDSQRWWETGQVSGSAWWEKERPATATLAPTEGATPEAAAASSITAGMDKAASVFEKVAAAITTFVQRLQTAEQQIANAR